MNANGDPPWEPCNVTQATGVCLNEAPGPRMVTPVDIDLRAHTGPCVQRKGDVFLAQEKLSLRPGLRAVT